MQYIGRFAPTPSGPLHVGSLLTALASYLDARAHRGQWLVRIEDLDSGRVVPGADTQILNTLERFGLYWDSSVLYQSHRSELYAEHLSRLAKLSQLYPCTCSRKSLAAFENDIYPGVCRLKSAATTLPHAVRIVMPDRVVELTDRIQGGRSYHLSQDVGDIILRRKDGYFAYHLAVVIDDHEQQITHVVRGCDLLGQTPIHWFLQECFGWSHPIYAHIPIVVDDQGRKLSKSKRAAGLDCKGRSALLCELLKVLLGRPLAMGAEHCSVQELMSVAVQQWSVNNIVKIQSVKVHKCADFC